MATLSPFDVLIGLVILCTAYSILHAVGTDIRHTHMKLDLARRVIARRERYLRELRGEFEVGEVEILEEDNPAVPASEVAA